ncbi:MAG: hypothetical protein ABJA37_09395 [Ferruginibacter sp.]
MEELLMECHEREILQQPPLKVALNRELKSLLNKCLLSYDIDINPATGVKYFGCRLTDSGREYLDKYSAS